MEMVSQWVCIIYNSLGSSFSPANSLHALIRFGDMSEYASEMKKRYLDCLDIHSHADLLPGLYCNGDSKNVGAIRSKFALRDLGLRARLSRRTW